MAAPTVPTALAPMRATLPFAIKGNNAVVWSLGDAPGSVLDADFQVGDIIATGRATALACTIRYSANGSGTANQAEFCFIVSNKSTTPVIGDDDWGVLSYADVSPAATLQADSMPGGFDATVKPEWDLRKIRPGYFQTEPSDTTSDKIRIALVVDVRRWQYVAIMAKEVGDTTNVGIFLVNAALCI